MFYILEIFTDILFMYFWISRLFVFKSLWSIYVYKVNIKHYMSIEEFWPITTISHRLIPVKYELSHHGSETVQRDEKAQAVDLTLDLWDQRMMSLQYNDSLYSFSFVNKVMPTTWASHTTEDGVNLWLVHLHWTSIHVTRIVMVILWMSDTFVTSDLCSLHS